MASALRRTARLARGGDNTTRVAEEGAEDGSWRRTAPRVRGLILLDTQCYPKDQEVMGFLR